VSLCQIQLLGDRAPPFGGADPDVTV
jgi:hypothetical protein